MAPKLRPATSSDQSCVPSPAQLLIPKEWVRQDPTAAWAFLPMSMSDRACIFDQVRRSNETHDSHTIREDLNAQSLVSGLTVPMSLLQPLSERIFADRKLSTPQLAV